MTLKKDLEAHARKARAQGFTVEVLPGGHTKWTAPSGEFHFSATTPSSTRGIKNTVMGLRKIGYDPNWKGEKGEWNVGDQSEEALEKQTATVCPVDGCRRKFFVHKMHEHVLKEHSQYWCKDCNHLFKLKAHYGRHMATKHKMDAEGRELVSCPYPECDVMVTQHQEGIGSHFRNVHNVAYHKWLEIETAPDHIPDEPFDEGDPDAPVEELLERVVEQDFPEEPLPPDEPVEEQPTVDFSPLMSELVKVSEHLTEERWSALWFWVNETAEAKKRLR